MEAYIRKRFEDLIVKSLPIKTDGTSEAMDDQVRELLKKEVEEIINYYNEEERKYHTLVHLISMFSILDIMLVESPPEYVNNSDLLISIEYSIFYHDIIYKMQTKYHGENEHESALLFNKVFDSFHDTILNIFSKNGEKALQSFKQSYFGNIKNKERVFNFIESTKDHFGSIKALRAELNALSKQNISRRHEIDALFTFLDLDLSILGASISRFNRYCEAIRVEYNYVDATTYKEKRAAVLESFLHQEYIYQTEYFRCNFEPSAKKNLKEEIERLRSS